MSAADTVGQKEGRAGREQLSSPVVQGVEGEFSGANRRAGDGSVGKRKLGLSLQGVIVLSMPILSFRPGPVPTPHGAHGRRTAPGAQQQHGGHWLQLLPGLR